MIASRRPACLFEPGRATKPVQSHKVDDAPAAAGNRLTTILHLSHSTDTADRLASKREILPSVASHRSASASARLTGRHTGARWPASRPFVLLASWDAAACPHSGWTSVHLPRGETRQDERTTQTDRLSALSVALTRSPAGSAGRRGDRGGMTRGDLAGLSIPPPPSTNSASLDFVLGRDDFFLLGPGERHCGAGWTLPIIPFEPLTLNTLSS